MNSRKTSAVCSIVAGMTMAACVTIAPAESTNAVDQAEWDKTPMVSGIVAKVPALKYPFPKNWEPTRYWWKAPLSFDNPTKLKGELQALAARGLSPCVELCGDYPLLPENLAKSVAEAKAVAAVGFPVNLVMNGVMDLCRTPDGKVVRHADSPDSARQDGCPCIPLKDGWKARAAHLDILFQKLADAKAPVTAVWYDYESHPTPWNGQFEYCQKCPGCRKDIPVGVLDDRGRFVAWSLDLWKNAMAEAFAKPVRRAFPNAKTGFYEYIVSSSEHPVMMAAQLGCVIPPTEKNPPEIDFVMPVCYAWKDASRRFFNSDWPIEQREMDAVYLATMLRGIGNHHWNLRPDQTLMPFVSSFIPFLGAAREDVPRMSKPLYREFLRHAILRGARGFFCYNVAPPFGPMPDYYEELVDINVVYNEMFAPTHREFLEGGTVLNDLWPDPKDSNAVVWSGLAKGKQALLRVMTLGATAKEVDIVPFSGGKAVRLMAFPGGASYRVSRSGAVDRLDDMPLAGK